MAECNAHYYATRDPLGAAGDFVTAPEVSQMFGELVGLCLADVWLRARRPDAAWVELGPGRGTLTRDALRAAGKAGLTPPVHLVETSPVLRAAQARLLPDAVCHDSVETLPDDRALLIVANEFFDTLPVRQMVREGDAWRERLIDRRDGWFAPTIDGGAIREACPAGLAIMAALAHRLVAQGGVLLAIDYGYMGPSIGDTLQAVSRHAPASPWEQPGEHDLTAHVDFAALSAAAVSAGAAVHGPVEQGQFLTALGIAGRAAALARASPDRAEEIAGQHRRLVHGDEMGRLFKALAVTAPEWSAPAGF